MTKYLAVLLMLVLAMIFTYFIIDGLCGYCMPPQPQNMQFSNWQTIQPTEIIKDENGNIVDDTRVIQKVASSSVEYKIDPKQTIYVALGLTDQHQTAVNVEHGAYVSKNDCMDYVTEQNKHHKDLFFCAAIKLNGIVKE